MVGAGNLGWNQFYLRLIMRFAPRIFFPPDCQNIESVFRYLQDCGVSSHRHYPWGKRPFAIGVMGSGEKVEVPVS